MPNLRPRRFVPLHQRPINMRPAILYMSHVSLLFEDTDGRKYRVISQLRLFWQPIQHLLNARRTLLPQHVLQPQSGLRISWAARDHPPFFNYWTQSIRPNLLDAKEAQTSTNYLVA